MPRGFLRPVEIPTAAPRPTSPSRRAFGAFLLAGGIDDARVRVVRSGIDLNKFDGLKPRDAGAPSSAWATTSWLWVIVAALAPHKAQNDLLRAAAIVSYGGPMLRFPWWETGRCAAS